MAQDYMTYLAANVLNDKNIVTYRYLSRALRVHCNEAKQMLYDFHSRQNAKKPGSVHATYLVSGQKRVLPMGRPIKSHVDDEGDAHMQSSPFMSSSGLPSDVDEEPILRQTMTLVRQEHLDDVLARYANVSSTHVYSLQPSSLQNLQVLLDSTRRIHVEFSREDPLIVNKVFGVIQNPHVKRRSGNTPSQAPAVQPPATSKTKSVSDPVEKPNKLPPEPIKTEQTGSLESKAATDQPVSKTGKPPAVKRETSDLFKSFAKSKPKVNKEDSGGSADTLNTPITHDVSMKDVSDDEDDGADDGADLLPKPGTHEHTASRQNKRAARVARLKALMDEEDEEEALPTEPMPEEEDDSMPIDTPRPEPETADPSVPTEPVVTTANGRRRGKRRVMKKKTMQDDEGYLITKEEAVWESFSENEPEATRSKTVGQPVVSSTTAAASANAAKAKKPPGKPGQGNIMSFFGKK